MSRDIVKQLKNLKSREVNPRQEWLENNREFLLSQISNTVSKEDFKTSKQRSSVSSILSIFFPQKFIFNVLRPIAILLIVISVASSGWINTVDAAYKALPGDFLYPAKRAVEKTKITVASLMNDNVAEIKLHSEYAKRRAVETKKVIADPEKQDKVAESIKDLKTEIANINDKLEDIQIDSKANDVADTVQDVSKNTEQIKNVLKEVRDGLLMSTSTKNIALTEELNVTKSLVNDVTIKAVDVVVSKHLEGDKTVTSEEVSNTIDKLLENVSVKAGVNKQNAESVQTIANIIEVDLEKKVIETVIATTTTTTTTSTTSLIEQNKEVVDDIEEKVATAREFLVSGDLAGAIDKLIEANEASLEAEKINDLVVEVVNNVAPLVGSSTEDILNTPSTTILTVSTTPVSSTTEEVLESAVSESKEN